MKKRKKLSISRILLTIAIPIMAIGIGRNIFVQVREVVGYNKRIEQLQEEISKQKDRTEELEKYKDYVNSREYKESIARNKLGLLYPDEIMLKPE